MGLVTRSVIGVVVVSVLSVLGTLSGFILPHQTDSCLDNYCYCENVTVGAMVLQPISYYSCISFYVVAFLICLKQDPRVADWYLYTTVLLLCAIGGFSMIFHSHQTWYGEYLDGLSISVYVWFMFVLPNPWFRSLLILGTGFIVGILFVDGAITIVFAVFVALLGARLFLRWKIVNSAKGRKWKWDSRVLLPFLSISIGFIFWMLSRDEYGCPITFGHGVWHIFTALTIWILYEQEKPVRKHGLEISGDSFLLTGANQYHQIWTRDTSMSLIALFAIDSNRTEGEKRKEIQAFVDRFMLISDREKHPVTFKHAKVYERGACPPSARFFGWTLQVGDGSWEGWDYTSIDSDLLLEIVYRLYQVTFPMKFFKDYEFSPEGFIMQEPFSDFQDSRARGPITFLTNLYYWKVLQLRERDSQGEEGEAEQFKRKLKETFFKRGLYKSIHDSDDSFFPEYFCLEDQLFAMLLGFDKRPEFALKVRVSWEKQYASSLLRSEGQNGEYNDRYVPVHWIPACVGLRHYHDKIQWPWLAYFYGGIFKTRVNIPMRYRYSEIIFKGSAFYATEENFLLSICFFHFYQSRISEPGRI